MTVRIDPSWHQVLESEFQKPYFTNLTSFVKSEYKNQVVYPPGKLIFSAFDTTPFDKVKVVILGQDPYHGDGQANGLAFSVSDNIPVPPSLQNIYKEIHADLGIPIKKTGNLESWAKQGVLLLNATLTVRAHTAGSHQKHGWEQFTDSVIKVLSDKKENLVFLLWGTYAQKKGAVIDENKHLVLKAPHPSPLSAHNGFFGCRHFSQANMYLALHGLEPINW
jgi:uracil-DNA glycosylase